MVTMSVLSLIGYIAGVIGFLATLVSAYLVTRSTATKTTIQSQKDLIETLVQSKDQAHEQIEDLHKKHIESTRAISNLQGQIDVLKNIPLKDISADLKTIASDQKVIATETKQTAQTQRDIIKILKPAGAAG